MSNPIREELLEARLIGLLANIMDFAEGDERDLDVIAGRRRRARSGRDRR
jgi:hypothetical protein